MALRRLGPLLIVAAISVFAAGATVASSTTSLTRAASSTTSPVATTSPAGTTTTTTLVVPPKLAIDPTVHVAISHLPTSLNPWTTAGADPVAAMIMSQVLPQASIVDSRGNSTVCGASAPTCPEPLFSTAELVDLSPEKIVYTLNPHAIWSDGVPISLADFRYLWLHVRAIAGRLPSVDPIAGYQDISSITASPSSPRAITVIFDKPYSDWAALFTNLLPSHLANTLRFANTYSLADAVDLVSGGPYRISKIIPGHDLVLTRNAAFWGQQPLVKTIIFRVIPKETAVLQALSKGSIDLAAFPSDPAVDAVVRQSDHLVEAGALSPVLWQLAFNVASPVLGNLAVRQAISMAVDRREIVENTVGLATGFSQTAGNRLLLAGEPGSQGNDEAFQSANVAGADRSLIGAHYKMGSNGLVETAAGHPLTLSLVVPAGSATISGAASEIQAQLLAAGITVTIRSVSPRALLGTILPNGSYELALAPFAVSPYPTTTASVYSDPVGPTRAVHVTKPTFTVAAQRSDPASLVTGSVTRDVLGFSDPVVTNLFAHASQQLNLTSELADFNEIDADLWDQLPTLPLFQAPVVLVARSGLLNLAESESPSGFIWNAENWAVEANPPPTSTTTTTVP